MPTARAVLVACALLLAAPAGASAQDVASPFTNPVIPGNVADPSVVRAEGAYWAAATSGRWAPVFPIFRSDDLLSWKQVGAVFPRPPAWARGNFWAPGLTVDRGRWSVYFSASRKRGRPCIAVAQASRPTGPWRDRGFVVCQPSGSIDAAAVRSVDGRRYLVWKRMGVGNGIYGARLSADGRRVTSTPVRLVVPNEKWEQGVTEGPDIVRAGDRYLLVYSGGHCCRPPCTYAVGLARAKQVLGPYTKDPANPVFTGGNGWKCPGHGTLVQARDGTLAFLHHAYREDDPFDVHRQALLDPVTLGADGWAVFGAGGVPVAAAPEAQRLTLRDHFAGRALKPGWQWPYDGRPRVRVAGGVLRVRGGAVSRAWVPRDFAVDTRVRGGATLSVLLTDGTAIGVRAGAVSVALSAGARTIARAPLSARALSLHVRAGRAVAAYARAREGRWRRLGAPVLAREGTAVDRVALGPGAFGDVHLRPLGGG